MLVSQVMNRTVSTTCQTKRKALWWRPDGRRTIAANGARKTTSYPPSIPPPHAAAAGFATISLLDNSAYCEKNYPDLWALMLKWDKDSPVTFKADGHTVHDYDRRFALEDQKLIVPSDNFRWAMLDEELQYHF